MRKTMKENKNKNFIVDEFICAQCGTHQNKKDEGRTYFGIMRHGSTGMNERKLIVGGIDDSLSDFGRIEAQESAQKYKESGGRFDIIVSSVLSRAVETAEIFAKISGGELVKDPRLNERSAGVLEGTPMTPEKTKLFFEFHSSIQGMEPLEEFEKRVVSAFTAILDIYKKKRVLFVTHAMPLIAIIKFVRAWKDTKRVFAFGIPSNCTIIEFYAHYPCENCGSKFYDREQ